MTHGADPYDYAIVGAGPAGLAVGIFAALAGRRAVVIERRSGTLDKACGEGLMPAAVARLHRLGVALPPGSSHPFRGIRYLDGPIAAEAAFVDGVGLGVRRTVLSEALLTRAAALGVEVRHGVAADALVEEPGQVRLLTDAGPIAARWLVGADGLQGTVRRAGGFLVRPGSRRRFGMRRHAGIAPWSDYVEVHWQEGLEAYVTPVAPARVGVAFLWTAGETPTADFDAFLARFPALVARLGGAAWETAGGTRGAGPFEVEVRPVARRRVLLVGDAAGYLDAITGEGIGLAFASAEALVEATARLDPAAGDAALARAARRYAAAVRRLRRRHLLFTRLTLRLSDSPALRHRVMRALKQSPRGWRTLLGLAGGSGSWVRALPSLATLAVRALRSAPVDPPVGARVSRPPVSP